MMIDTTRPGDGAPPGRTTTKGVRAMRHGIKKQMSYQRVLLAVYALADAEGLYCRATDQEIGRAAGRCASTVRAYLHDLAKAGMIAMYECDDGRGRWPLVLLDHPDAAKARRQIRKEYIEPHRRMLKIMGRL